MIYITYVIKSLSADKSYVGMTDNLERRLAEHNAGKSSFTKNFLPWQLIYKEVFTSRLEARKKEKYLKSAAGRKFLRTLF